MTSFLINPDLLKGGVVGFLLGSVIFGGGAYYFVKKNADEEIQSVIKNFNDEINKVPDSDAFKKEAEEIKKYAEHIVEKNSSNDDEEPYSVDSEEYAIYKKHLQQYEDDRDADNPLVREGDSVDRPKTVVTTNALITEDEFGELPTFEQFSLEYYPEANKLFDASDASEITEDDDLIDFSVLKEFGTGNLEDPDVIYYRNTDNQMDLEIIRVLGMPE